MSPPRDLITRLLEDSSFQDWVRGTAPPDVDRRWTAWVEGDDVQPFERGFAGEPEPDPAERVDAVSAAAEVIRAVRFQDQPVSKKAIDRAWNRFQQRWPNADRGRDAPSDRSSRDPGPSDPSDADPSQGEAPPSRPPRRPRRRRRLRAATRAGFVAALVLVVAAGLWIFMPSDHAPVTIATQSGEQATVTLPDDSRIVLNAHSRLEYDPAAFADGDRRVTVLGEALFEVTHRPGAADPAFRVRTADGTVRVLGTTFAVTHRDDDTRVVLQEGRVAIDATLADRPAPRDTTFELSPGDLVAFDAETGRIDRRRVNARVYTSWASGELVFDNTPLPEVVARIEATYDVNVVVEDPTVLDRLVSGSVENDLSVLIDGLSQILDRPINRRGNRIVIR